MSKPQVKAIIRDYLSQHDLSKVACITNVLPEENDLLIRGRYLNYICFCVPNQHQRAETLLLAYLYGLRILEYDVLIASPEDCLQRRQFGYVDFQFDDISRVRKLLDFVIKNKQRIIRKYPILARFRCIDFSNILLPPSIAIKTYLKDGDVILDIK
jgi:hypothetical protein